MTELEFQSFLAETIGEALADADLAGWHAVSTYADAGVLTHNRGLEVALDDGSVFQLTIVQSAGAREDES